MTDQQRIKQLEFVVLELVLLIRTSQAQLMDPASWSKLSGILAKLNETIKQHSPEGTVHG